MKPFPVPVRVKGECSPMAIPLPVARVDGIVDVLKSLADPTRLQIIGILRRSSEPVCICDLTATFNLSQPTISHHMAKLREAGLIEVVRRGIWAYYRLGTRLDAKTRSLLDLLA